MIEQETLFVLGAGASKPYGYPTGKELRTYICKQLPGHFSEFIRGDDRLSNKGNVKLNKEIKVLADVFKKSSIQSIDKFLSLNPYLSNIGKMAIATSILTFEEKSLFNEDISDASHDWYSLLYERMTEGFSSIDSWEEFKNNKVSFITFNYDRSLEYYLHTSFIHSFWQVKDAIVLNRYETYMPFPFIHVYGQLDKPTWMGGSKYASDINFQRINTCKDNIRVIGERAVEVNETIKKLFEKAERIFFLGFGYASENMKVLGLPKAIDESKKYYGTAKGFTSKELNKIRIDLQRNFKIRDLNKVNPVIEGVDSYKLLREYL